MLAAKRLLGLDILGAEHRYLKQSDTQGLYREDAKEILGFGGRRKTRSPEEMETLFADTENRIRDIVRRLRAGEIAVKPKTCQFCDYDPVCRFEKWKLVYEKD
jgi:ATP-dependent helicase/DNAse subunit B